MITVICKQYNKCIRKCEYCVNSEAWTYKAKVCMSDKNQSIGNTQTMMLKDESVYQASCQTSR